MSPQEIDQMTTLKSTFLSVPQEMRDHIYEFVFLTTTFLVKNPRTKEVSSSIQLHPNTHLAILNVSRPIYEEAKRVLYRNGHFRFNNLVSDRPLLHEVIHSMPAITLLQDITLPIVILVGILDNLGSGEMATTLINSFAELDPGVTRKRCVVEIEIVRDPVARFWRRSNTAVDVTNALGRLTGFKTVEVKLGYSLHWGDGPGKRRVKSLREALSESLTMKFGEAEKGSDERCFCWIYHPHRG